VKEYVLKDVDAWGDDQIGAAVGMVGAVFAESKAVGVYRRISDVVYEVARGLAEGTSRDPVTLGDELNDWIQNDIRESFVVMSWQSHHPGGGALAWIDAVDLGGGVFVLVEGSDLSSSLGNDLIDVLAVVDSLDGDEARDVVVDYLLRGLVPDYLTVPPIFTRDDIAGIFRTFLDPSSSLATDWDELAEIVGSTEPLESDDDKARILNLYLDRALTIYSGED
jgi:hypothetical protein